MCKGDRRGVSEMYLFCVHVSHSRTDDTACMFVCVAEQELGAETDSTPRIVELYQGEDSNVFF